MTPAGAAATPVGRPAGCGRTKELSLIAVVVDTDAGPMLPALFEILRPQGRYATCGAMGGAMVEIDKRRVYLKNLEIHGATQGTRRDFVTVRDCPRSGAIKPLLAGTYALADLRRARADFKGKNFLGRLVVEIDR